MTEPDFRPPTSQKKAAQRPVKWWLIVLVIAAIGFGAWIARDYWAPQNPTPPTPAAQPAAPEPEPAAPIATPQAAEPEPLAPAEDSSQPKHPLPVEADVMPADDELALDRMVGQWLDSQAQKMVVTPGLAHHVVATIDNLPRGHAAPRLWPIYPAGGKMLVEQDAQGNMHIAPANSQRYDAVVNFVTSLDPAQVARWYRQAYPILQTSYENLGYPGKYFNDRLVEVIDHLQQTPNPQEPLALRLVQVQGAVAPQQPWLRYEFADPDLQALSAGQKILLRIGPEHRQRIQNYLQAVRAQVTQKDAASVPVAQ